MKLLNEIVELLTNENGSLNAALLKTKVLLHEIGHKGLVGWVNSELAGYGEEADLPPYRVVNIRIFGNVTNGHYTYPQRPLMVSNLREKFGDSLEVEKIHQAVGVLEKNVAGSTLETTMIKQLGPSMDHWLSKQFKDGYYVEGSYSQISIAQIRQILIEVRSRLLDFILELRDEVGVSTSDDDAKERVNTLDIPGMFGKAVFGDNATIVIGNQNHQQITNTSVKNDAAALATELRKHGVGEDDIQSLHDAISEDPVPATVDQYGPAVRGWMSRMFAKAADGTWNIGIGAVSGVLTTVIQKYYGLPG
jgi:hypothetical protein